MLTAISRGLDASSERIERLVSPVSNTDLEGLARLLVDAVDSGAAVSFLAPLTLERARDRWQATIFYQEL